MCGIFLLLNHSSDLLKSIDHSDLSDSSEATNQYNIINNLFMKGRNRGPENSKLEIIDNNTIVGFHRLAINGLDDESNQPLCMNDCILICNGEIYNYKTLYDIINVHPSTNSDCEIIIYMYLKYGIDQTLVMLDGVFAFALYDIKKDLLFVARDPYGVRSLFYNVFNHNDNTKYFFASELKSLNNTNNDDISFSHISQFEPGSVYKFNRNYDNSSWHLFHMKKYHICNFSYNIFSYNLSNKEMFLPNIAKYLEIAVMKRCVTTERPIACLLSGGLDSSLITALVSNYIQQHKLQNTLETFSIGLKGAPDLKYAKIVANYLGTKHTEVIVTEEQMFQAIPEVIYAIETYDVTTIRASIGNYLVAKYISQNSDAKVIFNGDGSDELFGGYLYMKKCPDDIEFDIETRRLLENIHYYDVLRSDKSISSNGLEPRTPFLDKTFVNYILSIPNHIRNHNNLDVCEKYLLRQAFDSEIFSNCKENPLLPYEILWRSKEAFSDGVSSSSLSLFEILQNKISQHLNSDSFPPNIETEKHYYKTIFDKHFPDCDNIIPGYWMPKYTTSVSNDPSARTLQHYQN
jgi:asparagine synthase (glutamine-hydrolysing)